MLEHVPSWLGGMLRSVRAGHAKLAMLDPDLGVTGVVIGLTSPAFADGGRLPDRFTEDGEGVSPPLAWGPLPAGTAALALIVEDPDAPLPTPIAHAIVANIPPTGHGLAEGAIRPDGEGAGGGQDVGRNTFRREGWLPPDPPTGHGSHDYIFQLFALSAPAEVGPNPNRGELVAAIKGKIIGAGLLVGTYSRGEEAPIGPVGGTAVAPA